MIKKYNNIDEVLLNIILSINNMNIQFNNKLRENENTYDNMSSGIIMLGLDGKDEFIEKLKVISFNNKAKKIEPTAKENEYMSKSFPLLFDTEIPMLILSCIEKNEIKYIGDIVLMNNSNSIKYILYSVTIIPIADNKVIVLLDGKKDKNIYDRNISEKIKKIIIHMQNLKNEMLVNNININNLRKYVINSICELTESKYGYIGKCVYHENDECESIRLVSVNDNVMNDSNEELINDFNISNETITCGKLAFTKINNVNVYSGPVFTKLPSIYNESDIDKRRINNNNVFCPFKPNGNILKNFCAIPLIFANKVICVIGLACKDDDYNIELVNILSQLLDMYSNIEISYEHLKYLMNVKKSLIKANEAKVMFLSNLSHELRTPMNGIIISTEMLENNNINDCNVEFIECIKRSATNMMNLLDDLFQMTRIDARSIDVKPYNINVKKEIQDIINLFILSKKNDEKSKRIRILTKINDINDNSIMVCDIKLFNQIINNILSNAFKFTDKGFIEVRASLIDNGQTIKIEVEDTGIGIDEKNLNRIFDRFIQIQNEERTTIGAGIGLSLVKSILNLINGTIDVTSEVDVGSLFTVKIPMLYKNNNSILHKENNNLLVKDSDDGKDKDNGMDEFKFIKSNVTDSINSTDNVCPFRKKREDNKDNKISISSSSVSSGIVSSGSVSSDSISSGSVSSGSSSSSISSGSVSSDSVSSNNNNNIDETNVDETINVNYNKNYTSLPKNYINSDNGIKLNKSKKIKFDSNNKPNIVIVEDIESNQNVLKWLLNTYNINVIKICNNGKIYINWMKENYKNVDMVFMDAHMPILDGYNATKEWRKYEKENKLNRTTIIGLSASVIRGSDKGIESGMDMFIEKPIKSGQIEEIILKIKNGKIKNNYKELNY